MLPQMLGTKYIPLQILPNLNFQPESTTLYIQYTFHFMHSLEQIFFLEMYFIHTGFNLKESSSLKNQNRFFPKTLVLPVFSLPYLCLLPTSTCSGFQGLLAGYQRTCLLVTRLALPFTRSRFMSCSMISPRGQKRERLKG